jgi:hypothetical protein
MTKVAEVGPRVKTITEASAYRTERISSKGTSGETGMTSAQAHVKAGWKNAESDEPTVKPERRETEDAAEEACGAAA